LTRTVRPSVNQQQVILQRQVRTALVVRASCCSQRRTRKQSAEM
jgi:hypothetical protein